MTTLSIERESAEWLGADTSELQRGIVRAALADIGIVEMPPGSNRSPRIDQYVAAVRSPTGSRWCAAAVAAWWNASGAVTPSHDAGSCQSWMEWAKMRTSWSQAPTIGAAVIYGTAAAASHMGVIVRIEPLLMSVEGNTSISGELDPDGIAVALKEPNIARVLGYITPEAGESPTSTTQGESNAESCRGTVAGKSDH